MSPPGCRYRGQALHLRAAFFVANGGAIVVVPGEQGIIGLSDDVVVMRRGRSPGDFESEATEERILAAAFGTA